MCSTVGATSINAASSMLLPGSRRSPGDQHAVHAVAMVIAMAHLFCADGLRTACSPVICAVRLEHIRDNLASTMGRVIAPDTDR